MFGGYRDKVRGGQLEASVERLSWCWHVSPSSWPAGRDSGVQHSGEGMCCPRRRYRARAQGAQGMTGAAEKRKTLGPLTR